MKIKSLISLEILQFEKPVKDAEEAAKQYDKNVEVQYEVLHDVGEKPGTYVIRSVVSEFKKNNKNNVIALDPEMIPQIDLFEIQESIQEVLNKHDFKYSITDFYPKEEDKGGQEDGEKNNS